MASKSTLASNSDSGSPPETPVTNRTANLQSALVTPPNVTAASLLPSSIRRVHFSPSNEEIHSQTAPHSSPTRARLRPYSRSILKRSSILLEGDHQPSSDADYGDQRDDTANGRTMLEPAARVLFGGPSAGSQSTASNEAPQTFEEAFPATVKRLHGLVLDSESTSVLAAMIYNKLCGLSAKFPAKLVDHLEDTERLLDCVERDLIDEDVSRQVVLVAVKCLGCILHIANVCSAVPAVRIGALLVAMHRRISAHFKADKAVCQAGVWCVSMLRAPPASFQPLIPELAKLCARVLTSFSTSTSVQFECLSAIETLLRRTPGAMREVFHLWLLPVFFCIVNPVRSIRTNADSIIRQNIPWIAADLHGPEMDAHAQQFLEANFDRFLELSCQLFDRGEPVLLSRVWGMYVTIFAKHCRTRLNDMLKVVQQCFNSTDPQVLVAALMQWRCLIYAFYHSKQLRRKKCIDLILTPIALLLKTGQQPVVVRLACVRCWATLVYALGEEIGSNIDVITGIPKLLEDESDLAVREIGARVLAALLNRFVLADDKVPRFVIPQMIIGTTTLAASDGRGLSTTHGPFSSDSEYYGDHTAIMCRYIVGLSPTSPTLPVILDAMCAFIKSGLFIRRLPSAVECSSNGSDIACEKDFKSYGELCDVVTLALSAIEALPTASGASTGACSHDKSQIPEAIRKLVFAYAHATTPFSSQALAANRQHDKSAIVVAPRSMLYQAITRRLSDVLSRCCMAGESQFAQTFATVEWAPGASIFPNGSVEGPRLGLADEPAGKICYNLTLSVCRSKHHPDDSYQRIYLYELLNPTYLGMVRACGFAHVLERLGQQAREDEKPPLHLSEHMEADLSAPCFLPVAPHSEAASLYDLGEVAAMLCAVSRYLQCWEPGILIASRSQVEYLVSALEWLTTWIPLFEDRIRADLSAVVIRAFVCLFHRSPPVLQEIPRQSHVCENSSWDSGQFWRSSYMEIYDLLACDSFEASPEYLATFMQISARCWKLPNDSAGTLYRYMTAHLLVLSCAPCPKPELSHESCSWKDILPERFVLGNTEACVLHAHASCERLLQDLLKHSGTFSEGKLECARAAVKVLVKAVFSIGDSDAEHKNGHLSGDCLDPFDMSDMPSHGAYAGLAAKSSHLVEMARRLLGSLTVKSEDDSGVCDNSGDCGADIQAEDHMEIEDTSASAMSQPMHEEAVACLNESEACSTPRGKKRKRTKRRKSVTVDSSRETTPDSPPRPPPLPVSAPERLRRLLVEMETVVDTSSLQTTDICQVQTALAGIQLKLCQALYERL
ncbi:hypothetical protein GGH94_001605 [Coemansia aciculifera]|uniref:Telomere-associated protein Rif1 N-terminal domain-containing protein n=1 Tax=Coemansia aciculifera TaxID=417176 RepID=A0A9W8INH7_9FUNG|nr:hypothetical protein GGH94_001605 [Coemansia aciculifera]